MEPPALGLWKESPQSAPPPPGGPEEIHGYGSYHFLSRVMSSAEQSAVHWLMHTCLLWNTSVV